MAKTSPGPLFGSCPLVATGTFWLASAAGLLGNGLAGGDGAAPCPWVWGVVVGLAGLVLLLLTF